ncbi:MAG TPA: DUF2270 domain-containing protein [archaeon]|nr:DUF2270 domain-containing protein [archaeon]
MNRSEPDHPPDWSSETPTTTGSSAFHTAMAHLYRAEMHRMTAWRQRLDVTSNWAFLLTMGLTTFTLGSTQVPHFILLLGLAAIAISLVIEARRYRHLHHSLWRIRTMEQGYFKSLLKPGGTSGGTGWRGLMAEDLETRSFRMGLFTALRVRLRRNYLLLVYFITVVWITKIFMHPASPKDALDFYQRFAVGEFVPAWFVAITAPFFILLCTLFAVAPVGVGDIAGPDA